MVKEFGKLDSKLAAYTTEVSLEEILIDLQDKSSEFSEKYKKLNKELAELVDSHSMVSFFPLDVSDKICMSNLVCLIDRANGFHYYLTVMYNQNSSFENFFV